MNNDITTACESTKAKQYCANGDYMGWLVSNYDRKIKEGRAMDTTTEEARAKIEEIKQFRESLGGTNGF